MATARSLGSYVTYLELAKQQGRKGLMPLIEALSEDMEFFGDAHVQVCNDGTGYEGVRQFTQPTGEWRAFNQGVGTAAPTSVNYREPTGMLEGRFVADLALFRNMDPADARAKRARMISEYMSGMLKTFADTFLSGNRATDGKRPYGITQRSDYNSLSSAYVHDNAGGNASATANKTYILLIGWGEEKTALIHPEGSKLEPFQDTTNTVNDNGEAVQGLGVQMIPLHDDWEIDVDGTKKFMAIRNHLMLHFGIAIHDARFVQIGVNVSTSGVDGIDDFSIHEDTMIDMANAMPNTKNAVFYSNRTVKAQLRKRVNSMGNMYHTEKDAFGRWQTMFDDIPIHILDRIPNTGATIS